MSSSSSRRPTNTNNNNRVDANSVQSQFAALTRSRDDLRQQLQQMESDRRRHEREMRTLQTTQTQLSSETQVLHESLGKHRMKRVLLVTEKARLDALMSKERQQLEVIGSNMQKIASASTQSKQVFCKDLQHVSESMEDLMQKHEDKHWCNLLVLNDSNNNTIQILEQFIESRVATRSAGAGVLMHRDEFITANNKVQEYQQLHSDMMIELEALRQQANQIEPVSTILSIHIFSQQQSQDQSQSSY
jgi:chromosome segregation ATPase